MRKKSVIMQVASLLSLTALLVAPIISCGGGSSDSGPKTVTYTSAAQAAAGSSSAKASADMSDAISAAALDLSSSSNPSGYAPGKGISAKAVDTSGIANIDPRLKVLVDKMLVRMKAPEVKAAVSKARSFKTMSAPLSFATVTASATCPGDGNFTVTGSDTSTDVYNEYTVDVLFSSCTDTTGPTKTTLDGSMHVYDKEMIGTTSITREASVNITAKNYINYSTLDTTDTINGNFNSTDIGSSGANLADGSFSETDAATGDVATFYFTNMTGAWTIAYDPGVSTTIAKTVNGKFGFTIVSDSGTFGLDIALANLQDKNQYNWSNNDIVSLDEWVNGSITISWTPDLSAYGCVAGIITFTTADATPIHMPVVANYVTCPTSGVLTVNNATIEYGKPPLTGVTVTVGMDSASYPDCYSIGNGGMCN